jgi:hypothetical protein
MENHNSVTPTSLLCRPGTQHTEPNRDEVAVKILALMTALDPAGCGFVASPMLGPEILSAGQDRAHLWLYLVPKEDWPSLLPPPEEVLSVYLTSCAPRSDETDTLSGNYYLHRIPTAVLEHILILLEEGRLS